MTRCAPTWWSSRSSRLSGYPPEDLLFHRGFARDVAEALDRSRPRSLNGIVGVVGYPEYDGDTIHNSAILLRRTIAGELSQAACRTTACSTRSAISSRATALRGRHRTACASAAHICEDIWAAGAVARRHAEAGAEVLLVHQRLALSTPASRGAPRGRAARARRRDRPAGGLRQPRRRPGRAGVRRRLDGTSTHGRAGVPRAVLQPRRSRWSRSRRAGAS
jgi:hypothetical protein